MELRSNQSPVASSAPETPTTPLYNTSMKMDLSDTSLASVDMLNAMTAHRDNVHSADGKLIRKFFLLLHHFFLLKNKNLLKFSKLLNSNFKIFVFA